MLSFDGGVTFDHQAHPLHSQDLSIDSSRDLDKGQIFFRDKLSGPLRFVMEDYEAIHARRKDPAFRCVSILIRLDERCAGEWREAWRGRFSPAKAKYELAKCIVEVAPETVDRYTCILDALKTRVNVLEVNPVNVDVTVLPAGMEILFANNPSLPLPPLTAEGWFQVDTQTLTRPALGGPFCASPQAFTMGVWWRETITTKCLNGAAVTPAGTGWVQLNFCSPTGEIKWARPPVVAWPFGDNALVVGPAVPPPIQPPLSPACERWLRVGLFSCLGTPTVAGIYICLDNADSQVEYDTARPMLSVMERLISDANCGITAIRSDFFEWNPVGDAPDYTPGINYVIESPNDYAHLLMLHNSDAMNPTATNPAVRGELALEDMFSLFRDGPRVYWDIDDDGNLRLEHYLYWTEPIGLDIRTGHAAIEIMNYSADDADVPRIERASWMASQGQDHAGMDVIYDPACSGTDVMEVNQSKFVSDIAMVLSTPEAVNKEGFTVLATQPITGGYSCIISEGAITGGLVTNAPMAWANLQAMLWQWDRYQPSATMNGILMDFPEYLPNVTQEKANYQSCCLDTDFRKKVKSRLGDVLGEDATVAEASRNIRTDRVDLVLKYNY